MTADTAVKCELCKREDKNENMRRITVLVRGEEEERFAHLDCYERYRTKVARSMYKHRTPADKRKSFEEWREVYGY